VVQSVVVVLVIAVVTVAFLVDLSYVLVNPRLRAARGALRVSGSREIGFYIGAAVNGRFCRDGRGIAFWTPYDPALLSIADKLQPPSLHHCAGQDQLGRDVLSMIMAGARNSVGVALLSVSSGCSSACRWASRRRAPRRRRRAGHARQRPHFRISSLLLAILITAVFSAPARVNASRHR